MIESSRVLLQSVVLECAGRRRDRCGGVVHVSCNDFVNFVDFLLTFFRSVMWCFTCCDVLSELNMSRSYVNRRRFAFDFLCE